VRESAFDEIFDGQAVFRVLLDCLSRPGTVGQIPSLSWSGTPAGFPSSALAVLKTLCDHRVSFAVGSHENRDAWSAYLALNLGCPSRPVEAADYVLMDGVSFDPGFVSLRRGTPEVPEDSATVLLAVPRISAGPSAGGARIRGPGVKDVAHLGLPGLDPGYVTARESANAFYPQGIDVILLDADGRVAALPRTSRLELG